MWNYLKLGLFGFPLGFFHFPLVTSGRGKRQKHAPDAGENLIQPVTTCSPASGACFCCYDNFRFSVKLEPIQIQKLL